MNYSFVKIQSIFVLQGVRLRTRCGFSSGDNDDLLGLTGLVAHNASLSALRLKCSPFLWAIRIPFQTHLPCSSFTVFAEGEKIKSFPARLKDAGLKDVFFNFQFSFVFSEVFPS